MPIINLVYEAPSWPSLKSYNEIIAMSVDNAVAELNLYPTEYYNKFNSEWHMYGSSIWDSSLGRWDFANQQYNDDAVSPMETDVYYSNWVWQSWWPG